MALYLSLGFYTGSAFPVTSRLLVAECLNNCAINLIAKSMEHAQLLLSRSNTVGAQHHHHMRPNMAITAVAFSLSLRSAGAFWSITVPSSLV